MKRPPATQVSDTGNLLTTLGPENSFEAPDGGIYAARDCVSLSKPIPHPTTPPPPTTQPNVLAYDGLSPDAHYQGVRIVAIPHQKLAGGSSKPRKPRGSVKNNKSSFLSRGVTLDGFTKRINPGTEGLSQYLLVANYNRSLVLLDFDSTSPAHHEPLSKLFLTSAWPLCMDWNSAITSTTQLDLAIGTSAGDLLWLELVSNRYQRVNKTGSITKAPVTAVKWVPGSDSVVAAAHADGHVVFYDVTASEDGIPHTPPSSAPTRAETPTMKVIVSRHANSTKSVKRAYKLANQQLTALEFVGPNPGSVLAVTCRDGLLRFVDLDREVLPEVVSSFFAGFTDVTSSPDGRYFALAAEDDEVSVYESVSRRPVARLKGHSAWVNAVRFDPYFEDASDPTALRLGTVGEDCTLMLWEFSPRSLAPPRPKSGMPSQERTLNSVTRIRPHISQSQIPVVFPVTQITPHIAEFSQSPFCDLVFGENVVVASTSDGRLYTWSRP